MLNQSHQVNISIIKTMASVYDVVHIIIELLHVNSNQQFHHADRWQRGSLPQIKEILMMEWTWI